MNPRPLLLASLAFASLVSGSAFAQNTYPFPSLGNVGIGTTNPLRPLHLYSANGWTEQIWESGAVSSSSLGRIWRWGTDPSGSFSASTLNGDLSTGASVLMLSSSGNVGIGTASPGAKLHINAGTANGLIVQTANSGPWGLTVKNLEAPGSGLQFYQNSAGYSTIWSNYPTGANLSFNSANANLGVGTASPNTTLHVVHSSSQQSAANVTGLFVENNGTGNDFFVFQTATVGGGRSFSVTNAGNVGIGTTNPTHKLAVNGTIKAKEVIVETTGWSDYVFADDYALAPLAEVEAHIKEHKHLPGIPSTAEVAEQGVSVGEMQAKLLAKIEELTLHVIRLEKQNQKLEREVRDIRSNK